MKIKKIAILFIMILAMLNNIACAKYVYQFEETIIELTRDSTFPICTVSYSTEEMTNENVTITIKSNKEVEQASGFALSEDKKSLKKEVSANETGIAKIRDLSGNCTEVEYSVNNIDKEAPQIIGCEDGGIYQSPLNLEYQDNDQVKEINIDRYSDNLLITAYENEEENAKLKVRINDHPLNTRKYRYYVNEKLHATVTEESYEFTSFNKEKDEIKIEALDEFGNVLDTAIVEEISNDDKEEVISNKNELTKSGNYQIKVNDFAGNEVIYYIKVE